MAKKPSSNRLEIRKMMRKAKAATFAETKKNHTYNGYTGRLTQLPNGDVVPQDSEERRVFKAQLKYARKTLSGYKKPIDTVSV